tara:strand:+ start:78 stop:557 length:480 start_codon:yes stop_codon:yes gene_type:complete
MKTSITFDAYKLSKYLQSKEYMELKNRAIFSPLASVYKQFIREGNVEDGLEIKTIKNRLRRAGASGPRPLSATKPLYDTGKLVQSIRYDEKAKAIKGIHYSKYHIEGDGVPKRDFIDQTNEWIDLHGTGQKKGWKKFGDVQMLHLMQTIRRVFSRRLAK